MARRSRRLWGLGVLLTPAAWFLVTDVVRRADLIVAFPSKYQLAYAGSVVAGAVFWAVILYAASRRRGVVADSLALLFVALFGLVAGVQGGFHALWNVYLSIDGQIHSKDPIGAIVGSLPLSRPVVAAHFALAVGVGLWILKLARRWVRPRRVLRSLAPLLVPAVCVAVTQIPTSYRTYQATSADLLYFHGYAGLVRELTGITNDSPDLRVQRRDPMPVPSVTASPARTRNVVLILQESQRFDVTCVEYDPACPLATPWSNAQLPNRMPLLQMRANASTTAISISNIWSGVSPTESRELLHAVPLLWDYAHAAGYDTAYWTSQNLLFGNARLYVQDLPVRHFCVGTSLDPQADFDAGAVDAKLTDRVKRDWQDLEEPFFAVVHYSNPHYPYVYDPEHAPFQPAAMDKTPEGNLAYLNYYKNVVYLSDLAVAELVRHIRQSEVGPRTVLVYTADHGEAFRDHWQLGHTSSLYDEEVLAPTWIDAPEGTLSAEEEASIRGAKHEYVWHLDLAPTFLDLLGLWDAEPLAPFRRRMIGNPITRRERTVMPVPMTNCTWVWECAFRNWGVMQGPRKLTAREWDGAYRCFDVRSDPSELNDLGERQCEPLGTVARDLFPAMPNVAPPGRPAVDWGRN